MDKRVLPATQALEKAAETTAAKLLEQFAPLIEAAMRQAADYGSINAAQLLGVKEPDRPDNGLRIRHRSWGVALPAVDIDCLLCEYDYGNPKALIEYKHEGWQGETKNHNFRALIVLGDRARLPVFVCRYADGWRWFEVTPINELAEEIIQNGCARFSEADYKHWLTLLRQRR